MPQVTDPNHRLRTNKALKGKMNLRWQMGLALGIGLLGVTEAWAAFQVSPMSLTFIGPQGGTNPRSQSVIFSKGNNSPQSWTITDNATWVSVTPASGTMRRSASTSISVDTTGLAAGSYTATVTITVSDGSTASIPVTLTVPAATSPSSTSTPSSSTPTVTAPTSTSSSTSPTATSPTSTSSSTSPTATLSWTASTSTNVVGYNVYVGTASGVYGPAIPAGNVTAYVVNNNLQLGNTYYFSVTAVNAAGNESLHSNEVSKSFY